METSTVEASTVDVDVDVDADVEATSKEATKATGPRTEVSSGVAATTVVFLDTSLATAGSLRKKGLIKTRT